jgi:hypothetical protein
MPGAIFSHTNGSVTLSRAPHRPDNSLAVIQPRRDTGVVRFGFAHTITEKTMRMKIRATSDEKEHFLTFFNTIVNGMAELFVYTDPLGATGNFRFATPSLDISERAYNSWEIGCTLRAFGGTWMFADGSTMLFDDNQEIIYV